MDITKIEANKNIFISGTLGNGGGISFVEKINAVPFAPDYMIVHAINYIPNEVSDPPDSTGIYFLYTNIVGENIGMFSIEAPSDGWLEQNPIPTPKLYFKINKPIQGSYEFQFRQTTVNGFETVTMYGEIGITLEFIKLKAEKPQKIY